MKKKKYLMLTKKNFYNKKYTTIHKLMLKAGLISQMSSGLYTWLPTGTKILHKIKKIINIFMKKINGLKIDLPLLQSSKLWKKSGRIKLYGQELFKIKNKNKYKYVLGPTHEEIITKLISKEILSYKNFPIILYQIGKKFRNEVRPKHGIMRSKEFIMKDAYSFHKNKKCLQNTYYKILNIYKIIFKLLKLKFCIIKTTSKTMKSGISHEFQTFSKFGSDKIIFFKKKNKYYKIKKIKKKNKKIKFIEEKKILNIQKKYFCKIKNNFIKKNKIIKKYKIFLFTTKKKKKYPLIGLLLKKNENINIKILKKLKIPLKKFNNYKIYKKIKIKKKTANLKNIPIFINSKFLKNKNDNVKIFFNNKIIKKIKWKKKNFIYIYFINLSTKKKYKKYKIVKNSLEIGHIFQLNQKYSKIFNTNIKNKNSKIKFLEMGCYGIGISRLIYAIIEQNYDKNGIVWPINFIAPFYIAIIPIHFKNKKIIKYSKKIYKKLNYNNIDTLFCDNKKENLGYTFKDVDIIGIPYKIIINIKNFEKGYVEIKERKNNYKYLIKTKKIISFFKNKIKIDKKILKKLRY